jgi:LPXTG-motif cell wall-anchored protein
VDEAVRTSQEQSLPDTASPVPGMAFLGMAALGAGLGLKAVRRHATPR